MQIVITNAVLNNTGDAAIVQGIYESLVGEHLCAPDDITILDSNASVSQQLYPQWRILQQPSVAPPRSSERLRRVDKLIRYATCLALAAVPKLMGIVPITERPMSRSSFLAGLAALRRAEVVVSTGGTYLVDHYDFRTRIAELRLASMMGKPIFLWTQSMGPFKSTRAQRSIKRLSGRVSGVYFRDSKSMQAWKDVLPLPRFHAVVPDVVFALADKQLSGWVQDDGTQTGPLVGLSVREWRTTMNGKTFDPAVYRSALQAAARKLDVQGFRLTAVSTCQGTPGYAIDDSQTAREIFDGLPVSIDDLHHTPDELLRKISQCDYVIATRMHFAILALLMGKPVIAIAYEFKTMELFLSLGLGDFVIEIENVTEAWILARISQLEAGQSRMPLSAADREKLREGAVLPARKLKAFLQEHELPVA